MATPIPKNTAAFSLAEIVVCTGGDVVRGSDARAGGVTTDSRAVAPGDAFVALRGERFDGHDHVAAAVERGATVVVVSREVDLPVAVVRVPDTLEALGRLAHAHRRRWSDSAPTPADGYASLRQARRVVGITGSAGKTTTRHAVEAALRSLGHSVHASVGNLNNAIGVPMSLLGLAPEHELAVIEMGMNQPGEIANAARFARPDAAVLTLVSEAHTAGVGSIWGVLREKSEIFAGMGPGGVAIANADDDLARAGLFRANGARRILYGEAADADIRLVTRSSAGLAGNDLEIEVRRAIPMRVRARVPLLGRAGVYAALATAAVLVGLDIDSAREAMALGQALASIGVSVPGRLAAQERTDGTIVIDDAYNANPASMKASIEAAREIAVALDRRLVLVLGAMYELGERSDALHEEVGVAAAAAKPHAMVVVGDAPAMAHAAAAGGVRVALAADAASAEAAAVQLVAARDVVLVKASNSVGLSRVAARLASG